MAGQWKSILDSDQLGVANGVAQLDASGKLPSEQLPVISASQITGVLSASQIPNLDASKITSGTLGADRIPTLGQSKISGLEAALAGKVDTSITVNGFALSSNIKLQTNDLIDKVAELPVSGVEGEIVSLEGSLYVWRKDSA